MSRPQVKKTAVPSTPGVRKVVRTYDDGRVTTKYEARVKDALGKLTSLGQFDTLKAARAAQTKSKSDVQTGSFVAPSAGKVTFLAVAEDWLKTPKVQKAKPSTLASYRQIVHRNLSPLHAVPVNRLDYRAISRFLGDFSTDDDERPRAARTVQKTAGVLTRILDEAVKAKLVAVNPAGSVELPRPDDAPRHWLTEANVRQLVDWLRQATVLRAPRGKRATPANSTASPLPDRDKWATLVLFLAYTGCRAGEAAGLRVSDLNLLARSVRIERSAQYIGGKWHVGTPKSKAGVRTVGGLPRELVTALAVLVADLRPTDYVFGWVDKDGASVPFNRANFLRRVFSPALAGVGLPHARNSGGFGVHDLRHFHASLCIERGMTPIQVAKRLGHADATLVLKLYAHAWDQQPDDLADLFDASVAAGKAAAKAEANAVRALRAV